VLAHLDAVARISRRRRIFGGAAVVLAACAAVALVVLGLVRYAPHPTSVGPRSPDALGPAAGSTTGASVPVPAPPAMAGGDPEGRAPVTPRDRAPAPASGSGTVTGARAVAEPSRAAPSGAASGVPFVVQVRPYAQRALLDGLEVASDQQRVVFRLTPGRHRLRIEHPCCEPFDREIDAASAERLGEMKVPLVARPATLRVGGEASTRVYVDGRLLGTAGDSQRDPLRVKVPADGPNPYEGEVTLVLEAPGRRPASSSLRVRAGQDIAIPALPSEASNR
jgi:serine/threonine-protein kinase